MLAENRNIHVEQSPQKEIGILLIEGSGMLQSVIEQSIQDNSPRTISHFFETKSYNSALDALKNDTLDIIFLDWDLQDFEGMAFVEKTREIDENIPVIIFTSEIEEQTLLNACNAGVSAYIEKPIRGKQLWESVKEFLQ